MIDLPTIYQRRRRYVRHAVLFACFALGLALLTFVPVNWRSFMTLPNTGDLLLIGFIWLAFFLTHTATYVTSEMEYRVLRRAGAQNSNKPKRAALHLSDDGELTNDEIWEAGTESQRATSSKLR